MWAPRPSPHIVLACAVVRTSPGVPANPADLGSGAGRYFRISGPLNSQRTLFSIITESFKPVSVDIQEMFSILQRNALVMYVYMLYMLSTI